MRSQLATLSVISAAFVLASCGPSGNSIQNRGSDTMLEVGQAWAEAYQQVEPALSVEVSGGGSGTGIAALISGTVDIANASRSMEPQEKESAEKSTGKTPVEYVVGYDALAIYAHKDNPIETLTIAQLKEMYGDGGQSERWAQVGVEWDGCGTGEMVLVSRQNNSGTYAYFKEAVLGEDDFKLNTINQSGSRDVVDLVAKTPCAIGYSGMGYKTDDVKFVAIKKDDASPGVLPSVEAVNDKSYAIARPLYMYTLGEATGAAKAYLDWIRSAAGQKILADIGYVPLPKAQWTK